MPFPLLIDMAIHQFDLARDLIGSEPVAVYCDSYNPSWSWYAGDAAAQVLFEFADGSRFSFSGSWCSPGTGDLLERRVAGQRRRAAAPIWDGDNAPTAADGDGQPIAATVGDEPEQIAGSLAEFLAVLRTGAVPSGEAHSNVLSLAMVEAAITVGRRGSTGPHRRRARRGLRGGRPHRERSGDQGGPGVLEFGAGRRGAGPPRHQTSSTT